MRGVGARLGPGAESAVVDALAEKAAALEIEQVNLLGFLDHFHRELQQADLPSVVYAGDHRTAAGSGRRISGFSASMRPWRTRVALTLSRSSETSWNSN